MVNKRVFAALLLVGCLSCLLLPLFSVGATVVRNPKGACVIYGARTFTSSEISYVASNFGVLVLEFQATNESALAAIKVLNPSMLIFGYIDIFGESTRSYWSEVTTHEDWFVHDVATNRVKYGDEYVMNVSSGWVDYLVDYANDSLTASYDGVFVDDVLNQLSDSLSAGVLTDAVTEAVLGGSDIAAGILSSWHGEVVTALTYVKANVAGTGLVVVNTNEYLTDDYLDVVDGRMDENKIGHPSFYDLTDFVDTATVLDHIDAFKRDTLAGKIVISENGADDSDVAGLVQNSKYSYAATLLGVNGSNAFIGYNKGESYTYDNGRLYMPSFVDVLGVPSANYFLDDGVYQRQFSGGLVLFNPSDSVYSVSVGSGYEFLNGSSVGSSLVMGARVGEILVSESASVDFGVPTPEDYMGPVNPYYLDDTYINSAYPSANYVDSQYLYLSKSAYLPSASSDQRAFFNMSGLSNYLAYAASQGWSFQSAVFTCYVTFYKGYNGNFTLYPLRSNATAFDDMTWLDWSTNNYVNSSFIVGEYEYESGGYAFAMSIDISDYFAGVVAGSNPFNGLELVLSNASQADTSVFIYSEESSSLYQLPKITLTFGVPSVVVTPSPSPTPVGGVGMVVDLSSYVWWIVTVCWVFGWALLLFKFVGKYGFIAGMTIGTVSGYVVFPSVLNTGNVWFLFGVIFLDVVMVLRESGE